MISALNSVLRPLGWNIKNSSAKQMVKLQHFNEAGEPQLNEQGEPVFTEREEDVWIVQHGTMAEKFEDEMKLTAFPPHLWNKQFRNAIMTIPQTGFIQKQPPPAHSSGYRPSTRHPY